LEPNSSCVDVDKDNDDQEDENWWVRSIENKNFPTQEHTN
jgi:hypothetical protein